MTNEISTTKNASLGVFSNMENMRFYMVAAQKLAGSDLVPKSYKNKPENVLIAMDMANRMGISPMMVMQNLEPIHGQPSWSSKFLLGMMQAHPRFEGGIKFEVKNLGQKTVEYIEWVGFKNDRKAVKKSVSIVDAKCRALSKVGGETVYGSWVSIEMAVKEGWYMRIGSKWQTMPEQMLKYRAGSFFAKIYAADLTLGLSTSEDVMDAKTVDTDYEDVSSVSAINEKIAAPPQKEAAAPVETENAEDEAAGDWI